jgi:hypothetical protein
MHIRLGGACDERLVVFKVVLKKGDDGCLRIGPTIVGKFLQWQQSLPPFIYLFCLGGLLGLLFIKGFGCSSFLVG